VNFLWLSSPSDEALPCKYGTDHELMKKTEGSLIHFSWGLAWEFAPGLAPVFIQLIYSGRASCLVVGDAFQHKFIQKNLENIMVAVDIRTGNMLYC
jgi:hypothetical protein